MPTVPVSEAVAQIALPTLGGGGVLGWNWSAGGASGGVED